MTQFLWEMKINLMELSETAYFDCHSTKNVGFKIFFSCRFNESRLTLPTRVSLIGKD